MHVSHHIIKCQPLGDQKPVGGGGGGGGGGFAYGEKMSIHRCLALEQCFPNLSWRTTCPAHFVCLPNQTPNLVLAVSTNELMSGVFDKGDIQKV